MKLCFRCIAALAAGALLSAHAAQLGDSAPPLEIAEWLNGPPVNLATAKGQQVVVLNFWIPGVPASVLKLAYLAKLQTNFANQDVVFAAVAPTPRAAVVAQVQQLSNVVTYAIGVDDGERTARPYLEGFSTHGLPKTFVIDKAGHVVWIGHPAIGLSNAVVEVLAGTLDLEKEKQRVAAQRKVAEFAREALLNTNAARVDQLEREVIALDQQLGGIVPGGRFNPAEIRRDAQFQRTMRLLADAVKQGAPKEEIERLSIDLAMVAPTGFNVPEFITYGQVSKATSDYLEAATRDAGPEVMATLAKRIDALQTTNALVLNDLAWVLLTDKRIKQHDVPLALRVAKRAFDACDGQRPEVIDTYARALFDHGEVKEAISLQKRAIARCRDERLRRQMQETLDRYEASTAAKP